MPGDLPSTPCPAAPSASSSGSVSTTPGNAHAPPIGRQGRRARRRGGSGQPAGAQLGRPREHRCGGVGPVDGRVDGRGPAARPPQVAADRRDPGRRAHVRRRRHDARGDGSGVAADRLLRRPAERCRVGARPARDGIVVSTIVLFMFAWITWQFALGSTVQEWLDDEDFTGRTGIFPPIPSAIALTLLINAIYFGGATIGGGVSWRAARQRDRLQALAGHPGRSGTTGARPRPRRSTYGPLPRRGRLARRGHPDAPPPRHVARR